MNRKIVAGVGMVAGALAAALVPIASANASGSSDVDPFGDAGVPLGGLLDASLPFPIASELDHLVDIPTFDPNDFAVSVNGTTLFQVGTATAHSGIGDIAIADGAGSSAFAGAGDAGQFDTAVADGPSSTAISGNGNFDSAFANGTDDGAVAGGGSGADLSNGDFASVVGSNSNAFAGGTNDLPSSNDVAIVVDPVGSVGSNAFAESGIFDFASVAGDAGRAGAGFGDFDIAQVLAGGLTATATNGSFLTDIMP